MDFAPGLHFNLCSDVIDSRESRRLRELHSVGDFDLGRCWIGGIRSLPKTQIKNRLTHKTRRISISEFAGTG